MKKLSLVILAIVSMVSMSFIDGKESAPISSVDGNKYVVPADVQSIIDNSCYGCHNSDSRSTKGKMKLNFDKMSELKTGKLVGKLSKISKTVKNGKMPKKSFIEKYPEKALTEEQSDKLTGWADDLASQIGGE